jgi:hypothetical protein
MDAPHDLTDEGRALFDTYLAQLQRQGTFVDSDYEQLASYVRHRVRSKRLYAMADEDPVVEGSMGQPIPSKFYGEAEKAEKMALSLERALLLTARERKVPLRRSGPHLPRQAARRLGQVPHPGTRGPDRCGLGPLVRPQL